MICPGHGMKLLKRLYRQPYVSVQMAEKYLDITPATANTLIREFVNLGILAELPGRKRHRRFVSGE